MHNKTFFTSDNHFSHKRIQEFCPLTRFGSDVLDMNERMVAAWNAKVPEDGVVWCLGDFSFGGKDSALSYIKRLNGTKHLVYGNHDKIIRKNADLRSCFASTQEYKEISVDGIAVIMFHYPIREWNHMHHGAFHLYGHVHGGFDKAPLGRSIDVGIDTRFDMAPWSWVEIKAKLELMEIRPHHGGFRET